MRSILRAPWLLGVLALAACIPGIAGGGHVVSERRIVQPWTKLDVQNGMSVTMSVGESYVTVRSDDNLLGYLETYVDGDTLVVRERPRTVLYATVAEAIIANPVLEGVDVSGGSHLTAVATPVDELRFTVSGGSHARASSRAGCGSTRPVAATSPRPAASRTSCWWTRAAATWAPRGSRRTRRSWARAAARTSTSPSPPASRATSPAAATSPCTAGRRIRT